MTTMTLVEASFAPVADLSDVLLIPQSTEVVDQVMPGSVRTYAGGRRRTMSRPGSFRQLSIGFAWLSRNEFDDLSALAGTTVLFRDVRGRRAFGAFFTVSGQEARNRSDRIVDVSLTLEEVTYSEVA